MKKFILILLLFAATASAGIFLNSFNSGQLSKDLKTRHDLDRTYMGSEELENILIRPQGMAFKRPGTEFIANGYGKYTAEVVEIPATYAFTYISENGIIWGIPVGDGVMTGLDADDAVNIGGGIVGLPFTGHPFTIGETIRISGTTNYNGEVTVLAGTTANQIRITENYIAETFDSTEVIVKRIGSLRTGNGRMVQDSTGNMYYGHTLTNVGEDWFCITKVEPDGTLTYDYDFLDPGWLTDDVGIVTGLAITPDDQYLYVWYYRDAITDYGYLHKFDLTIGNLVWNAYSVDTAWPGYNMAIDEDGNGYAPTASGKIRKFAVADGAGSFLTSMGAPAEAGINGGLLYDVKVDNDLGIVIAGGRQYATTAHDPNLLYNFGVRTFDDLAGDTLAVGGYFLSGKSNYTPTIGSEHIAISGGYIYVLFATSTPSSEIHKLQWDGTDLIEIDDVAGPDYGVGLYFDLYGNLVVVNQDITSGQTDGLYFYDTDLAYLSKIDNMYSSMLSSWDASAGGSWIQGNAVFDGYLGTAGVPAYWSYSDVDPNDRDNIRLIPFEYATNDAYVLEFGHQYIGFLRTTR